MKLKLTWIPCKCLAVNVPHYDLHTVEEHPSNIACIATNKEGARLIRKWIKKYNQGEEDGK